ncbi:hypothetical protein MGH68_12885 [Erysipelothrix sp. D19-032]
MSAKHKNSKYTTLNLTWTFFPKLEDRRVPNEVMWPTIDMEFEGHMLPMPPRIPRVFSIAIWGVLHAISTRKTTETETY